MPTLNKEDTAKFFVCRSSGLHNAGHDDYGDGTWQGDEFIRLEESGISTSAYNQQVNTYNTLEAHCEATPPNLWGTDNNDDDFQISVLPQRPRPKPK